jgi:hypothetical protein
MKKHKLLNVRTYKYCSTAHHPPPPQLLKCLHASYFLSTANIATARNYANTKPNADTKLTLKLSPLTSENNSAFIIIYWNGLQLGTLLKYKCACVIPLRQNTVRRRHEYSKKKKKYAHLISKNSNDIKLRTSNSTTQNHS